QNDPKSEKRDTTYTPPKPLNMRKVREEIGYPKIAADAGIQGRLIIRVLVDTVGRVKKHEIVEGIHPVLTEAVVSKIDMLRFSPAFSNVDGKPIAFWLHIPFSFKLIKSKKKKKSRSKS
ncbi:MAG: energy transducer TonB, partial [Bacteroidota bacterium]